MIGAGVHGASAAFHLASFGARPVVFDSRGVAAGPTGRSSAVCRAYYTNAFLARCARDSIEMMRNFAEITGRDDCGFRETGFLFIHPPKDRPGVERAAGVLNALGIDVTLFDANAVADKFADLDPAGIGIAAWEAHAGHADPVGTTRGLLGRAIELGATAQLATDVSGLKLQPGAGVEITTRAGGRFEFDRVLIAAGPWTRATVRKAGLDIPLSAERHFIASFGWSGAPRLAYGVADIEHGYYMRPEGRDFFIMGELGASTEVDPDAYDEHITFDEIAIQVTRAFARIPRLESAESRGGWASLYDVSPDWQPVIGEIAPGLFVDAGTSGHGFKLAPALGKYVAELVLARDVDPGIAQFHPRRFDDARPLAAGYGAARVLG